jgi:hypothetical protein
MSDSATKVEASVFKIMSLIAESPSESYETHLRMFVVFFISLFVAAAHCIAAADFGQYSQLAQQIRGHCCGFLGFRMRSYFGNR